jgi:hypothetical protein
VKERRIRRWEHREQQDEEYRLREQQGLPPPPTTPVNSSSEGGAPPQEVESPIPVTTGRGGSARGGRGGSRCGVFSERDCGRRRGASERHSGAGRRNRGAPEPSRKGKRGFSSLR